MKSNYFKGAVIGIASCFAAAQVASAAVTLEFGQDNFLGESGQTSGITWGVVFDVDGNGFNSGSYEDGWTIADGKQIAGSAGTHGDVFYLGDATTLAVGDSGGIITNASSVGGNSAGGLNFAIIWFNSDLSSGDVVDAGTDVFGFLTDVSFTAPGDGYIESYSVRGTGNADLAFVPEPSAALLGAFGGLLLLRRRREALSEFNNEP